MFRFQTRWFEFSVAQIVQGIGRLLQDMSPGCPGCETARRNSWRAESRSTYQGVLFRNQGDPVLNLKNPDGLPRELQRKSLDTIARFDKHFG